MDSHKSTPQLLISWTYTAEWYYNSLWWWSCYKHYTYSQLKLSIVNYSMQKGLSNQCIHLLLSFWSLSTSNCSISTCTTGMPTMGKEGRIFTSNHSTRTINATNHARGHDWSCLLIIPALVDPLWLHMLKLTIHVDKGWGNNLYPAIQTSAITVAKKQSLVRTVYACTKIHTSPGIQILP